MLLCFLPYLHLQNCSQYYVNLAVGGWYVVSLIASLCMVLRIPVDDKTDDTEPLLEMSHTSPVAFRVPNLPDFAMDPVQAKNGIVWLDMKWELGLGILMALVMGGLICSLAIAGEEGDVTDAVRNIFLSS